MWELMLWAMVGAALFYIALGLIIVFVNFRREKVFAQEESWGFRLGMVSLLVLFWPIVLLVDKLPPEL